MRYEVDPGHLPLDSRTDHGGRDKCVEIITIPQELWGIIGDEPYDEPRIPGHIPLMSPEANRLHLTEEELKFHGVERLPECWNRDVSATAARRGVGTSDPKYKQAKIALYERAHELRSEGLNNRQIAEELRQSRNIINRIFSAAGKEIHENMIKPTAYEQNIERVLRLRRKGLSVQEVALRIGKTRSAVREWLDKYEHESREGGE